MCDSNVEANGHVKPKPKGVLLMPLLPVLCCCLDATREHRIFTLPQKVRLKVHCPMDVWASVQECLRSEVAKLRQPLQSILLHRPLNACFCTWAVMLPQIESDVCTMEASWVIGFTRFTSLTLVLLILYIIVFLLLNRISTYIHTVSNMCGSQLMYHTLILNLFHQENGADKSWWKRSA